MIRVIGAQLATLALLAGTAHAADEEDMELVKDYRTFQADGTVDYGQIADSYTADLVMYLAGNQFMVMEELIGAFQAGHPEIETIYVETIPPGQILQQQLLKQGEINGEKTAQNPDLFASVNLNHLKKMASEGLMEEYIVYIHNKLELMVAAGNPMGIKGLGLYEQVTGNAECKGCWAVPDKTWFTERHHRETPARIEAGEADVGIVWTTEVAHAVAEGLPVEGVAIPAPLNKQDEVAYAIGALTNGRNQGNAEVFLDFLIGGEAQAIYERYGFVGGAPDELERKPLLAKS
jgi:ABC-type molybdate transport system substrate-binding protein